MEFVQGGADRHLFEEEDTEEQEQRFSHHPPFTRAILAPSSSSSSSSSSARWAPQQMDSTDDHPNQASGSTGSGGGGDSSEQRQRQRQLAAAFVEKEHMFDKVVTPSDVGKLNRLVIPKQHAEKYFPLDASGNEKGLLLNFEDRSGQQWRFRYSYWNSSQSYVMTKGWSRFVKEKRLDAGDTVSFGRGVGEAARDRLFIDWRRRPVVDPPRLPVPGQTYHFSHHHDPTMMMSFGAGRSVTPWGRLVMPPPAHALPSVAVYDHHHRHLGYGYSSAPAAASNPFWYLRSAGTGSVQLGGAGSSDRAGAMPVVLDSVPLVPSSATAKRVRLFGVNLDCAAGDQEADSEGDGMAASGRPRRPPPLSSLQLRLGISAEMVESPTKGKQPMSLDLGM